MRFFMVEDLQASPQLQAMMGVLIGFGWNLKMVVAFTSDVLPIGGYRRKPYLYFGLILYMVSFLLLGALPPQVGVATALMCFITIGQMTMGVMCDTLIVENMRHESKETQGKLQTECWCLMTLGGIIGTLGGGFIFYAPGITNAKVFMINAMLKLLVVPFAMMLLEKRVTRAHALDRPPVIETMKLRSNEMWVALQNNKVWQPTMFIFLFAMFPNPGTAMTNFFINELGFSEEELSYIAVVASVSGALGMYAYYRFFKEINWHWFFFWVIITASALSLTQLLLVFHINRKWGIPDLVFALGDETVVDVTNALLAMPVLILVASICPLGVESSLYALVTSVQAAGGTVGGTISGLLIRSFGITLHNYDNLWKLIVLCAGLKVLSVFFIPMLPSKLARPAPADVSVEGGDEEEKEGGALVGERDDAEQQQQQPAEARGDEGEEEPLKKSKFGAATVLFLLVVGICWSLGQSSAALAEAS
uniref:Folate/biopterin transporter n=1 Tax=Lotharella oceanica TaxID=641309 RepID=A0A7S2TLW2_9EUKA